MDHETGIVITSVVIGTMLWITSAIIVLLIYATIDAWWHRAGEGKWIKWRAQHKRPRIKLHTWSNDDWKWRCASEHKNRWIIRSGRTPREAYERWKRCDPMEA